MKRTILTIVCFLFVINIAAQENKESIPEIKLSGFVKTDFIYDSRQTISLREGHFLLYPANENKDVLGNDLNAKDNFNILSIQTRLNAKLTGPEAFGAKSGGMIEGEFFGTTDGDINGFRLRHAFVTLSWSTTTLLFGQTWHPMLVADVYPLVVSFNTGVPFQPFSRNPQVRLTQSIGSLNIIAALLSQRDFSSNGPSGFTSAYLRNAVIPNAHLQFQYKTDAVIAGVGGDFKSIQPRLETIKKQKTNTKVSSFAAFGYFKYKTSDLNIMLEGIYGGNLADLFMLGGYAVKSLDTLTGKEDYTVINSYSVWGDFSFGKDIQPGIFFGYSQNLGSNDVIKGSPYSRVSNIDKILRVSPRIIFNSGKVRIACEVEYTSAAYGSIDSKAKVTNTKNISNLRALTAVYYFF